MVGFASKDGARPQLLDLIPKERDQWFVEEKQDHEDEEKKLELRLGPPVEEDWRIKHLGFFNNNTSSGAKRVFSDIKEPGTEEQVSQNQSFQSPCPWKHQTNPPFLQLRSISKESSQLCTSNKGTQKNAFAPSPATANNTAVPCPSSSDQKRIGAAPVVGWPPIRSSRKNLINNGGGSSSKADTKNGLFVKINMEGVAIGRKVDLKAYDSYEKLSTVVDELFRGLLAAQRDSSTRSDGGEKAITGLLDGSGEFTLVYEDYEGDRVLVGDVPWDMFVCTVRRLRVIKSSEIPKLCGGVGSKKGKPPPNAV